MAIKLSIPMLKVLKLFLEQPEKPLFGFQIVNKIHINQSTVYPLLIKLETAGYLKAYWEKLDPTILDRPRRRYYQIRSEAKAKIIKMFEPFQLTKS